MPDILNTVIGVFLYGFGFVLLAIAICQPIIAVWASIRGRGRFLAYLASLFLLGILVQLALFSTLNNSATLRSIFGSEIHEGIGVMTYALTKFAAPTSLALTGVIYSLVGYIVTRNSSS